MHPFSRIVSSWNEERGKDSRKSSVVAKKAFCIGKFILVFHEIPANADDPVYLLHGKHPRYLPVEFGFVPPALQDIRKDDRLFRVLILPHKEIHSDAERIDIRIVAVIDQ